MKEIEEIKFYKVPIYFKKDTSPEAEEVVIKMSRARGLLHMDLPFFGFLLSQLEIYPVDDAGVGSFAMDSRRIYINADFFKEMKSSKMRVYLLHAIIHLIMKHGERSKGKNSQTWGISCDINTHSLIRETLRDISNQFSNSKYFMPDTSSIPSNLHSKNAEEINETLYKFAVDHLKDRNVSPVSVEFSDDIMKEVLDYSGIDDACNYIKFYEDTQKIMGKELKIAEENRMMGMIKYAYDSAKRQGKLPGSISNYIEEMLNPRIPWYTYLEQYIQHSLSNDYRWVPPNRRFIHQDIILPSIDKENIDVVIALDTSGSISNHEMQMFLSESLAIFNSFGNINMTVIQCDAAVQHVVYIMAGENVDGGDLPWEDKSIYGRGGTSFVPVFDYIVDKEINTGILLYFTDGYGTFPDTEPEYDTIWIMTTDVEPPFGSLIRYHPDDYRN